MKEIIKTILASWKSKDLPEIIKRELDLGSYVSLKPRKIIVITGFRRVGKTYAVLDLIKGLLNNNSREEVVYINFEDERIPEKIEFLTQLIPTIKEFFSKNIKFLFLDEIQDIQKWSKWVRRIYDNESFEIFVTGSSSKTSSRHIPTELRGRFLEIKIFPLSFSEFLKFKKEVFDIKTIQYSDNEKGKLMRLLNEYLEYGALPEIVLSRENKKFEISQSYYKTVIRRDLVERYNIKNEEVLKALLRLLLNSKQYSISKLYNTLKSLNYEVGKTTIQKYLGYIEDSYFMFSVPVFSYKVKDQLQYPRKNYFIDNSFINSISTKFSKNFDRMYENIVAVYLLKKFGDNVFYWESEKKEEVDFVIKENIKVSQLIQVCYNISDLETKKREVKTLLKASKELKCKNLLIVNSNYENEKTEEWFGIKGKIKYIPLWKWLLNQE